ncbi:MAG: hypothetical protein A2Y12_09270 [Planctomycetes bacterium GWF2_42_9]|nr:MAG: hypothetical protein A2Y12_09270 [Planctomycetes bacterium GWF2_42_9]
MFEQDQTLKTLRIGGLLMILLIAFGFANLYLWQDTRIRNIRSGATQTVTKHKINTLHEKGPSDAVLFAASLAYAGIDKTLITNIEYNTLPSGADITVANVWHYQPYQLRLQMAQNLWKAWARINSPDEPDMAKIRILDLNGNEVGGSRVWGGSLIWVQQN